MRGHKICKKYGTLSLNYPCYRFISGDMKYIPLSDCMFLAKTLKVLLLPEKTQNR